VIISRENEFEIVGPESKVIVEKGATKCIESLSLAIFTHCLHWEALEVQILLA
jgi:hypothetical protein